MAEQDVLRLLEMLNSMITEAWSVPLGNDRCIIERDKALSLLSEIKARLPAEMAEAKRIVSTRDSYVGSAKTEAEAVMRSARDRAQELIDEQAVVKEAKRQSAELLSNAENRTRELYRVANAYVDDLLRKADEAINGPLLKIRETRATFRTAATGLERGARPIESSVTRIERVHDIAQETDEIYEIDEPDDI